MLIIVRVSLGFGYETKGAEGEMSSVHITMPSGRSTSAHIDSVGPGTDIEFNDLSLTHRSTRETYGDLVKKGSDMSI